MTVGSSYAMHLAMRGRLFIVGLGSNLGQRYQSILGAAKLINGLAGCQVLEISPVLESKALGPKQPPYCNAALRLRSTLPVFELLRALNLVEKRLGRRRFQKWGPRTIDLDILWAEGLNLHSEKLQLPHPGLIHRPFALIPLLQVAPELHERFGPHASRLGHGVKASQPPRQRRAAPQ
ncbi:MAG: 2-amino-4-hydroxy-6-hydroxymethyldihydropteridine diphosphokinase [Myxococcales bacterium]|nr:MAG: 2-amino-4-hydroxy-6-hydroxymethyldihydropteridine diphosphokinase [Myxococcales bacterium]